MICLPAPAHDVPFLVGGHSPAALGRAGRVGDGWLAQQSLSTLDPEEIERASETMRAAATASGRDAERLRVVLRIVEAAGRSDELAPHLPALARAGVDEIIVDALWDGTDPAAAAAVLREAAAA